MRVLRVSSSARVAGSSPPSDWVGVRSITGPRGAAREGLAARVAPDARARCSRRRLVLAPDAQAARHAGSAHAALPRAEAVLDRLAARRQSHRAGAAIP